MVRYERGDVFISIETIVGFGENPGLWIGTKKSNTIMKVASFRSEDKARLLCKWVDYLVGINNDEKAVELNG